jgi:chromosome partitioning protein
MHVIAISNRKGGTGKTTVSVNLAAELAALGQRVLLIDLDSQGHCAVGFGIKPLPGSASVHRLFVDPAATLSEAILPTALETLWIAPADPLFDHGSGPRNDQRLRNALHNEQLAQRFDLVIIDTPPSLDALLVNGLMAASRVLVPYVPHFLSYEGVRQLMRVLFRIMTKGNRNLKILGFLPTMAAEHIRQHRAVTLEVRQQFGAHRVLPGIRNDIRLAEAFAAGQPVRLYAPKSRGATDFAQLALHLAEALINQELPGTHE